MKKKIYTCIIVLMTGIIIFPAEIIFSGARSSRYGISPFPTVSEWSIINSNLALDYDDNVTPTAIWIVTEQGTLGKTIVGFPCPSGTYNTTNMEFKSVDENEDYLNHFDATGVKVFLQVESAKSSVNELIKIVFDKYGHHESVIGFGVDIEWYRCDNHEFPNENNPVPNDSLTTWMETLKSYSKKNEVEYKLFLKHFKTSVLPTNCGSYGDTLALINDTQDEPKADILGQFKSWAAEYPYNIAMFQYGYPNDYVWWKDYTTKPPKELGLEIKEMIENDNSNPNRDHQKLGMVWVDFTLKYSEVDYLWSPPSPYSDSVIIEDFANIFSDPNNQTHIAAAYGYSQHGDITSGGGYWTAYVDDMGSTIKHNGYDISTETIGDAVKSETLELSMFLESTAGVNDLYCGFLVPFIGAKFDHPIDLSNMVKLVLVASGSGTVRVAITTKDICGDPPIDDAWGFYGKEILLTSNSKRIVIYPSQLLPATYSPASDAGWTWDHGKNEAYSLCIDAVDKGSTVSIAIDSIMIMGMDYSDFGFNYKEPFEDITPPVISGIPEDITKVISYGALSTTVTWVAPTATDNSGSVTLTSDYNIGDSFNVGVTTVTYTATDPAGNETTASFTVTVHVTLNIALKKGWNMISFNVVADDMSPTSVLSNLTNFEVIEDISGKSYGNGTTNNLILLDTTEAYYLYVSDAENLAIVGTYVDCATTPISLEANWNLLPYLPKSDINISTALTGINNLIKIVKDDSGNIFIPDLGINDINKMKVGKGYKIYMKNSNVFTYTESE